MDLWSTRMRYSPWDIRQIHCNTPVPWYMYFCSRTYSSTVNIWIKLHKLPITSPNSLSRSSTMRYILEYENGDRLEKLGSRKRPTISLPPKRAMGVFCEYMYTQDILTGSKRECTWEWTMCLKPRLSNAILNSLVVPKEITFWQSFSYSSSNVFQWNWYFEFLFLTQEKV